MARVRVISVGRAKEAWIEEGINEFIRRMRGRVDWEQLWLRDDEALIKRLAQEKDPILLSPDGKELTSESFAEFVDARGARLCFVVGGAEGLPPELLKRGYAQLSLSQLTFTHQMARLILAEQVYRAYEIIAGSKYHK